MDADLKERIEASSERSIQYIQAVIALCSASLFFVVVLFLLNLASRKKAKTPVVFESPSEEVMPTGTERMAVMPLQTLISTVRDDVSVLIERLHVHGHEESDLYSVLTKMLPALEREAGRTPINAREILRKAEQDLDDSGMELQEKSPVMGVSNPQVIHSFVAKQIARARANKKF